MLVYGQTIAEVHHWYWKFLKVPGSNKTLNLASYFCLEVGRGHVSWDEVIVLFQSVDCFTDKLSLVCLWKRGNDLAHHSTSAPKVSVVACGAVYDVAREDHIAGDGGGAAVANT